MPTPTPKPTFAIEIEHEFCAAHAIVIQGQREPLHGHNWQLRVTLTATQLDDEGLLCDFHAAQRILHRITAPFNNTDLNATPPFDTINPTAECIAEHIANELIVQLPEPIIVESVRITEAPGCAAIWRNA